MDGNNFEKTAEQAAAFQKIWADSMTKVVQTAFGSGQNSPPPEILKQIRSGVFQALAQSWDEFMRSPQFLESMKQWMDSAINFRKMTNDFMGKVRNEMQAPSRDDMDNIMLAVRHMEKRLLDRVEALSDQIQIINQRLAIPASNGPRKAQARRNARSPKRVSANRKGKG
jgi:hypothetical protein